MKQAIANTQIKQNIDLQSYFNRIGYKGDTRPSFETLQGIHYRHVLTIPFENLNPLLGIPVRLDLPAIWQKLVIHQRGGYCFEQNLLLSHVLQAAGFTVRRLAARVLWGETDESQTMRTHMMLLVETNGESFIADAGFGGMTLTSPLRLIPDIVQATNHEPFRLLIKEGMYVLQVKVREEWKLLYSFGLDDYHMPDYQVFNYYLSTHPESHLVTDLIAARPTLHSRCTLRNNSLAIHHLDGTTERHTLGSVSELQKVLTEVLGIHLPGHPKLAEKLQREIEKGNATL